MFLDFIDTLVRVQKMLFHVFGLDTFFRFHLLLEQRYQKAMPKR